MSKTTLNTLRQMKQRRERFAVLTAYDASFTTLLEAAGIEVLLVGDSLGMVVQGQATTLPVSLDEMVYHTRCVTRSSQQALVIADMPFLADATPELAINGAARLMKEGGAEMVKIEGGMAVVETVALLARRGVPVCGHLGLMPQSVHKLGGYRVQGRDEDAAEQMVVDALALQEAGADLLVLECVPAALAKRIAETLTLPVIGIGAGPDTDGQVLVLYDMLGITPGKRPSFSKDFLLDGGSIDGAIRAYVTAVKGGSFPGPEHTF